MRNIYFVFVICGVCVLQVESMRCASGRGVWFGFILPAGGWSVARVDRISQFGLVATN